MQIHLWILLRPVRRHKAALSDTLVDNILSWSLESLWCGWELIAEVPSWLHVERGPAICLFPTTNQIRADRRRWIREHISLMRQDWGLKTNQTAQITRQARIRNPNKQTTSSNHVQLSEPQSRERPERVYPACNGEWMNVKREGNSVGIMHLIFLQESARHIHYKL